MELKIERAFIVEKGCKFYVDYEKYQKDLEGQRKIVFEFMDEKGIESKGYLLSGSGFCGIPFKEKDKGEIRLGIIPTPADKEKFGKELKVPKREDICFFRADSDITKEIAQRCIDNNVVINVWRPRISDYFKSMGFRGGSYRYFEHEGTYYFSIECDGLDPDETPEGFTEIKLSEFYKVIETIQEAEKDNKKE